MAKPYALLVLFALFFTACTPIRVVRVEPEAEEDVDRYLYGSAIQHQEIDGVGVDVSYYDASNNYLVFHFEMTNNTERAFDFDPATIRLIPDLGSSLPAIDPEIHLLGMDMDQARRRRNARTMGWVGAGLLVAGTVATIAADSGPNTVADVGGNSLIQELTYSVADALVWTIVTSSVDPPLPPAADEIPIPENRFFWLDHALRITTVRPGETVMGKVAFPRSDESRRLEIVLTVDDRSFSFPFRQRSFKP